MLAKKESLVYSSQATGIGEKEPRDLIRTVQELLGHSDLCMVYVHVMNRELMGGQNPLQHIWGLEVTRGGDEWK